MYSGMPRPGGGRGHGPPGLLVLCVPAAGSPRGHVRRPPLLGCGWRSPPPSIGVWLVVPRCLGPSPASTAAPSHPLPSPKEAQPPEMLRTACGTHGGSRSPRALWYTVHIRCRGGHPPNRTVLGMTECEAPPAARDGRRGAAAAPMRRGTSVALSRTTTTVPLWGVGRAMHTHTPIPFRPLRTPSSAPPPPPAAATQAPPAPATSCPLSPAGGCPVADVQCTLAWPHPVSDPPRPVGAPSAGLCRGPLEGGGRDTLERGSPPPPPPGRPACHRLLFRDAEEKDRIVQRILRDMTYSGRTLKPRAQWALERAGYRVMQHLRPAPPPSGQGPEAGPGWWRGVRHALL